MTAFVVDQEAPARFSMSFLRDAQVCLRGAHHRRKSGVGGPEATVGRVFHEVAAAVGFAVSMRDETVPDLGEVDRVARRVLANPEDHDPLPREAWTEVIDLAKRWAQTATFRPGQQFEVLSVRELGGRPLSARLDAVAYDEAARTVYVDDYKTGWGMPSSHPVVGPEGEVLEQNAETVPVQGEVYAWHAAQLYPQAEVVIYSEEWVRFGEQHGPFVLPVDGLDVTEAWLGDLVARVDAAYAQGGELPTGPGSLCPVCPVSLSCPVPEWARPSSEVRSEDDAQAQMDALLVEEQRIKTRKQAIRDWLEATDRRVLQHAGEEIGWPDKPGTKLDKKLAAAAGVDLDKFRVSSGTTFGRRKAR